MSGGGDGLCIGDGALTAAWLGLFGGKVSGAAGAIEGLFKGAPRVASTRKGLLSGAAASAMCAEASAAAVS